MPAQPYTKADLDRGEQIVRELHALKGFEAWAERIAKALAEERSKVLEAVNVEIRTLG